MDGQGEQGLVSYMRTVRDTEIFQFTASFSNLEHTLVLEFYTVRTSNKRDKYRHYLVL